MRLLESYSRSCSVPIINRPKIVSKFIPLPTDKYITIQSKSGMPAKDYSYFQEVLDILKPLLDKQNIKVIHIGQDSTPLNNTINFNNQTNIGQAAYIINNSLCHISVDSWSCHYAAANNVPLVALYGSTTVENHSPYHFDPSKSIFLESHRNGQKASFQREEPNKTVDLILPEEIAKSVSKLLNLELDYPYKTVLIGKSYQNRIIESACDGVVNTQQVGIPNILMRLDYNWNLAILAQQSQASKISIITDKIIPIDLLRQIHPQIIEVLYEVKQGSDPNFCKSLQELKIPYRLYSKLNDEKLNPLKLDYIDYNLIGRINNTCPKSLKDKKIENLWIKGAKFIISNKGLFNSYWAYKANKPISDFNAPPQQLVDINIDSHLWYDIDYLIFLEKV